MGRPFAKLASTLRWHQGATGIPYWQALVIWTLTALVLLSFVVYLLGSPSPGALFVIGIVVGGVILGNTGHPSTPPHIDRHRHGDGRCVYSDGPVSRCIFPEDPDARAALRDGRAPGAAHTAAREPVAEDDDWFPATDAKSVLGPTYRAAHERKPAPSTPAPPRATEHGSGLTLLARLDRAAATAHTADEGDWVCPIHQKPGIKKVGARSGRAYIGCPDCNAFARGIAVVPTCTAHPGCGPVTRTGHSGHGHGPSEATGLWCWHFDEWYLGRPDEVADEGSDLAARRAQQAEVNGGDPFAHKTYPTAQ